MNPVLPFEYLTLWLAVLAAVVVAAAWLSSAKCGPIVRALTIALRAGSVACLALIAFNPGRWQESPEERKQEWALLVDRSSSMAVADAGTRTRWAEAVRLAGLATELAGDDDSVQRFAFAERLENAGDTGYAQLQPTGTDTDILQAGLDVLGQYRSSGRRLTGMLIISDGRQVRRNADNKLAILARARQSPIYVLPLGGTVTRKDISISTARRQYVSFTGQKLKIAGWIQNEGMGLITPAVTLVDAAGKTIAEQKVTLAETGKTAVQFELVPTTPGYTEYSLRMPRWDGEDNANNNQADFAVAVQSAAMRILMVEGIPFWDTKFVAQLLRKQPNVEVTSIYRLASDRFFKVESDADRVANTSEPVFPDTATDLASYDVVIFGKGAEYFLTPERVRLLRDFVANQGGCVIFSRGKPYAGALPEIEPLEPVTWGEPVEGRFRFRPTEAGEFAGLFGELLPARDDSVWGTLPTLQYAHRCPQLKSFTDVLAEGVCETQGEAKPVVFPAVVSRRLGRGIVLAVNAEGLWQWFFFPSSRDANRVYQEFWTQLLAWATIYSEFLPGLDYSLRLSETAVFPDTPVLARVFRRPSPGDQPMPVVRVMRGKAVAMDVTAVAVPGEANRWDALVSLTEPGAYRLEIAGVPGMESGAACATLVVKGPPMESDNLSANPAFLEELAKGSGGRSITAAELSTVVKELEPVTRAVDMSKAVWVPLWDKAWLAALIMGFLGLEWIVRRRSGLL